jgi:hypothetical protein
MMHFEIFLCLGLLQFDYVILDVICWWGGWRDLLLFLLLFFDFAFLFLNFTCCFEFHLLGEHPGSVVLEEEP